MVMRHAWRLALAVSVTLAAAMITLASTSQVAFAHGPGHTYDASLGRCGDDLRL